MSKTKTAVAEHPAVRTMWENVVKDDAGYIGWMSTMLVPVLLLCAWLAGMMPVAWLVAIVCGWLVAGLLVKKIVQSIVFNAACRVSKATRLAIIFTTFVFLAWALASGHWMMWASTLTTVVGLLCLEWAVRECVSFENYRTTVTQEVIEESVEQAKALIPAGATPAPATDEEEEPAPAPAPAPAKTNGRAKTAAVGS